MACTFEESGLTPLQWELFTRLAWTAAGQATIATLSDRVCPTWMFDAAAALAALGLVDGTRRTERGNPFYRLTRSGWALLNDRVPPRPVAARRDHRPAPRQSYRSPALAGAR